jgi:anti-sigma regulatory factor (Ser/Thr protein kinase)
MDTQRFTVALATDGDVTVKEIAECLVALGYHGVYVTDEGPGHEHPCPSAGCLDRLRREGHFIPASVDCCICWARAEP